MAPLTKDQHQQRFDEALRKVQVEYDPKIHGAGTVAPAAPDTVSELNKIVMAIDSRLRVIESAMGYGKATRQPVIQPPASQQVEQSQQAGKGDDSPKPDNRSAFGKVQ